jgi:hypothetical protein
MAKKRKRSAREEKIIRKMKTVAGVDNPFALGRAIATGSVKRRKVAKKRHKKG